MKTVLIAAAVAALTGTALSAQAIETVKTDLGNVAASAKNGMTLYTFRNDAQNASNCYDDCAAAWPPFTASASAKADGALGIIKRKDGSLQWAMNGKPLYFWAGDSARGEATGNGVGGVWDVVRK